MKTLIIIAILLNSLQILVCQNSKTNMEYQADSIPYGINSNYVYSTYEVDIEPQFPGGKKSLKEFINSRLEYNAMQTEYEGIICVCFVVDKKGKLRSFFIPGEVESVLFKNFIDDIFMKMPDWEPGSVKGIKVNTIVSIPFLIQVE